MNTNTRTMKTSIVLACALLGFANLFAAPAAPAKNVKKFPQMENPAKWVKNASKGTVKITFDQKEKAVCIQETFAPKTTDRWIYPRYNLQLPQESLKGAKTISFEWKAITEKPLKFAYVMALGKDKTGKRKTFYLTAPKPTKGWSKCTISLTQQGLDPATVTAIQIGMNPVDDNLQYFIRNIQFTF